MGGNKDGDGSFGEESVSSECHENGLSVKGPPFHPKDYMISPSDSDVVTEEESLVIVKKKILPIDLKFKDDVLDARKSLKKLRSLIRSNFGKNLIKRHENLVRAIVKGMPSGFLMEDIASVTEIVEYFIFNYKSIPEYFDMINMILKISVNPPRMTKSSEMLNFKEELSSYFTLLGELLTAIDDTGIQFRVMEILNFLLVRSEPVDLTCVKLPFCYAAMEESLLPDIIASLLETVQDELYIMYLNITLQLALTSKKACIKMCLNGAMEYILRRLDPNYELCERIIPLDCNSYSDEYKNEKRKSEYYDILDMVGHLMWVFLNTITDSGVCPSPSRNALQSLRCVFIVESKKRTEKSIKTRNNIASIVMKLYTVFGEALPLLESGLAVAGEEKLFFVDLAMLAVATEIGTKNTWAEDISFGISKEDYFLKELMMLVCCAMIKDSNMTEILKKQKVLEGILCIIKPDMNMLSLPWSPCQFIALFKTSLALLTELVPLLPEIYVANEGNARLILIIIWYMEKNFEKLPVLDVLKTLCAIVSCKNKSIIIQDLKKQNASETLLNFCYYLLRSKALKKNYQEKLTRIFFILVRLGENEKKIQACCGVLYVSVSINFLTRATKNCEENSTLEPSLLICFSAFLWETIVWCPTLLTRFAEQNGIYLLLDLIEISSYPVQIMLLGLLVDAADEGETLTYLLTWRDKNGYGILDTMIKIWKKEELLHKVPRTETGCIADIERVLMTEEQWYLTHRNKKVDTCSPSIAEMICSARPKVHSLYRIFRERYGELTKLNESLYSISFGEVQPQNQVYIPLIEHFFNLKLGEIWYEIYNEVIVGGLVPTLIDGDTLLKLIERKNEWARRLKVMQEEIVLFNKDNDTNAEGKLYELIRSCCLTSALDALHELDFIARSTYKDVEIKEKAMQLKEIEGSLEIPHGTDENHIHRSTIRDSNVTYLCGKYVWCKSEREVVPKSNIVWPVSPNSSSCSKIDF